MPHPSTAPLRRAIARALALTLAAAIHPALAADEAPPVYVTIDVDGSGWSGEGCEGGEWNVGWSGPVAVEPGPLADLLISYTAFDTTQSNQLAIPPAKFDAKPVRCRDNHGNVVLRGNVETAASNDVHVNVSLADDDGAGSPAFRFSADELGTCRVSGAEFSSEQPVMVSVDTRSLASLSPALQITLDDLRNGFDKSYRFDGAVIGAAPMCMGHEITRGTLRMRYRSGEDDPTVAFDACLHLAKNEVRDVSATGTPAGGAYRWSTSGPAFTVNGRGANAASVRGQAGGKGDVTVQYERSGRVASATVAGSVVDVVSVNGGSAIPKLGLFGTNGLRVPGTRDFPLKLDPVDGLVTMTVEDEAIASVVNTSSRVQLQPTKIGRTTMQAKTLCGTALGPKVPIEVVRCDDDVQRELRAQQQQLKARIDQLVKRITQLTASADFQEAATEIAQSTKDMAIKTGESIVGTLSFGGSKRIEIAARHGITFSKPVVLNQKRIEVVSTVWDIGDMLNDAGEAVGSPSDWQKVAKPLVSLAVKLSQNEAVALGKTYGEAYLAAEKFGKHLGTLAGVAEQLEQLEPQLDLAVKEYVRISTRLEYCERASTGTGTQQPGPQPPKPGEKPPVEIPIEEPVEIPVPEEPTPPPVEEPPPPVQEPGKKVYGLACRVQDLRAPGVGQRLNALRQFVLAERTAPAPSSPSQPSALASFTTATIDTALARAAELRTLRNFGRDLDELKKIADAHVKQLAGARTELQQWQGKIDRMQAALDTGDEQSRAAFADFRRARDEFVLDASERGWSSFETLMETDECRDRLEVKVDQVRVRYN